MIPVDAKQWVENIFYFLQKRGNLEKFLKRDKNGTSFLEGCLFCRRQDMVLAADFSAFVNDQLSSRNMDFSLDITCWGNPDDPRYSHHHPHFLQPLPSRPKSIPQLSRFSDGDFVISGDFSLDRSMYDKFVTGMYRSFQDQIFSNKTDVFFVKIRWELWSLNYLM